MTIPFSARKRERDGLRLRTFSPDPSAVSRLETAVASYHGCHHAIAFDTPASAMAAALVCANAAGGSVITGAMAPQHHYSALTLSGADMRLCDIGLDGSLYANAVERSLSPETRALLFTDFEGITASRPTLPEGVALIEDVTASPAPASVGAISVWSLAAVMPEGVSPTGFLLTNNAELAATAALFRQGGRKPGSLWNYDLPFRGMECTLDALAAAVALLQLETLPSACARRREHAALLDERLGGCSLFDRIKRAPDDAPASYPILLTPQLYCPKEDIFTGIREHGVDVSVCCKPVYKTTAYRDDTLRLPVTEDFYKALLQLPCHHRLNETEIGTVAEALLEATEQFAYRGCRF